ncbi:hypothetical protein [Xanthocytophaga agilis]|uniref:Terminase n=1 Tax=Xanthocytophaga agilis TaxID=3048010 RepID=A0AAE3UEN5_9BACT|nr:hypothetical protein [Xanthocytophaga agilis]MDJ1500462.1 hypothetical protein [Xanthocytophaga agilis]
MQSQPEAQNIYYNRPILNAMLIDANQEYHIWGRGTAKSSGLLANKLVRNITQMPRSAGMIIGETYIQLLTRTLPSLISGLERLGLRRDHHYYIGRKPPKSWKWKEPYEAPVSYDHFMIFYNGAGAHLISQDRVGSSNGLNTDWVLGDEAKYLNYNQFLDESLPTMRANRTYFGHLHTHQSICFATSMPTAAEAKWILKKKQDMDQEQIDLMFLINKEIMKAHKSGKKARANALLNELNLLRKDCVHFSAASSFENIAVLGERYFRNMRRIMPDFIWETEILNIEPNTVEGGFYPYLDAEGKHGYSHSYNNAKLEEFHYNFDQMKDMDSRFDLDCISTLPIRAGVDWGSSISTMSIAQDLTHTEMREYRFINALYVKHPKHIDHLAKAFVDYYRYHTCKELILCYDPAGDKKQANSDLTYAQQFMKIVRAAGWTVIPRTKASYHLHPERYLLWARLLSEEENLPRIRFNKRKAMHITTSMANAPAYDIPNKGIRKNKDSEKNTSGVDPLEATHFSDSADYLLMNDFNYMLKNRTGFVPNLM